MGAILLGLIYQFYYGGGDTFGYTTFGSHYIWESFLDNPVTALKLIFLKTSYLPETFKYASQIWYFQDPPSYFVVRVAGLLGIITFDTYSSIAVLFACISFSGLWALYTSLHKMFPNLSLQFAIALFFIPSVVFWGSGIMKDTLTLAALSWATYAFSNLFVFNKGSLKYYAILLVALYVIYLVKIYILICFLPAIFVWFFFNNLSKVKHLLLRISLVPV
ncbi:MAG: hypothetical protein ACR2MX_18145, partial [Cyclobacteriaceae bacterium]